METVFLSSIDVDEIFALYEQVFSVTPYGFLAIKTKQHFSEIFRDPGSLLATGIRRSSRLIAYSICHRIDKNPYAEHALLSAIEPQTSIVYHGAGTVIDPAYQMRQLGKQLFRVQFKRVAERGVDHLLGLVAIDNFLAISCLLHSGYIFGGFMRDETAMNYTIYAGRLCGRVLTGDTPVVVGSRDRMQQKLLFERRHVICGLNPAELGGEAQFRLFPIS